MKKLLLALLLMPTLSMSQNRPNWEYDFQQPISADFPAKLPFYRDYLPLQNTYYELNITLNNIRQLVSDYLKMTPKQNAPTGDGFLYEIYTNPTHREALKVKYNTFTVYGLEVVKSIEISGGFANVAKLFIYMYDTNFSTNQTPENQAKKSYKQDMAVFTVSGGKASILITNTKYGNDTSQFIKDFNDAKNSYLSGAIIARTIEYQKRIEYNEFLKKRNEKFKADSIARREQDKQDMIDFDNRQKALPVVTSNVYFFTKTARKIEFSPQPSEELEKLIIEKVSGYKKGNYSAAVTTTSVLEKKTYDIKINQRQR